MHHLHETLTGGFYYLKNISKTIWILVMSFERVHAPFQMSERNTTDPFHVTRVAHTADSREMGRGLTKMQAGFESKDEDPYRLDLAKRQQPRMCWGDCSSQRTRSPQQQKQTRGTKEGIPL